MPRRYYTLLAILIAAGFYLTTWPWNLWPIWQGWPLVPLFFQRGLPKVGDAFIIAATLAIIVDRSAKEELLRVFTLDVSHHIIGNLLPTELRGYVFKYLHAEIVRVDWNITYIIERMQQKPGYLKLTTLSEYELRNLSLHFQKYKHSFAVDLSWVPNCVSRILNFSFVSPKKSECFEHKDGDAALHTKINGTFLETSREVTIPPAPHGQYKCIAESEECFPDRFVATFVVLTQCSRRL